MQATRHCKAVCFAWVMLQVLVKLLDVVSLSVGSTFMPGLMALVFHVDVIESGILRRSPFVELGWCCSN